MDWGATSYNDTVSLVGKEKNMDFKYYGQNLRHFLVETADGNLENDWILQQDNAPVLSSNYTKQRLEASDIDVLEWSARSPDSDLLKMVGN